MDPAEVTRQIDVLLDQYEGIRNQARFDDLSDREVDLFRLSTRIGAAVERLLLPSSAYAREMEAASADDEVSVRVPKYIAVLLALKDDVQAGWLQSVSELIHGQTFDDLLDQATELLDNGYANAAAVIGGTALESHLRLLAAKVGVPLATASGKTKKADVVNADLVKAGTYNTIQQKTVTAWLAVRNAAAHGSYDEYEEIDVRLLVEGIRKMITRYPA